MEICIEQIWKQSQRVLHHSTRGAELNGTTSIYLLVWNPVDILVVIDLHQWTRAQMSCGWLQLTQLYELPTYVGHSGKPDSLLDLAFSSDSSMVASVDTLQPVSDHLPILLKKGEVRTINDRNIIIMWKKKLHEEQW